MQIFVVHLTIRKPKDRAPFHVQRSAQTVSVSKKPLVFNQGFLSESECLRDELISILARAVSITQRPCQLRRFQRCGKRPERRRDLRTCR